VSKVRGRPFPKGVSGNPRGRPPSGEALAEYIRDLGGADGKVYIDRLHAIAIGRHKDTRNRLTAIGTLLERGFGKPPQAIEHSGNIGRVPDVSKMSDQELEQRTEQLLMKMRAGRVAPEQEANDRPGTSEASAPSTRATTRSARRPTRQRAQAARSRR
jgi:hypothetical protein